MQLTHNKGDKAMNIISINAAKEETPPKDALPKGIKQEQYDTAKKIIVSGFKAEQGPDSIKSALFEAGIPFSKLQRLFQVISIKEGLAMDPKDIKKIIDDELKKIKWTFEEDWSDIAKVTASIKAKAKGSTDGKIHAAIKALFVDNEAEMPRKPAAVRGRIGVVPKTVIDVFAANKKATLKDLEKALVPLVKSPKVANDYAKMYHKIGFAIANGMTSLQVMTDLSSDK